MGPGGRRFVLASASPRRRELLAAMGVEFEVVVPRVDELVAGDPAEVVLENARRKARAGLTQAGDGNLVVLGVDTDVAIDGRLLGKAHDETGARERLAALAGRTHEVLSGLVLLGPGALLAHTANKAPDLPERVGVARTRVTFRELEEATIDFYLRSGEWRDRAGAYAIQGLGSILVERIEGDFSNVVGLPIASLLEVAPELGITI